MYHIPRAYTGNLLIPLTPTELKVLIQSLCLFQQTEMRQMNVRLTTDPVV